MAITRLLSRKQVALNLGLLDLNWSHQTIFNYSWARLGQRRRDCWGDCRGGQLATRMCKGGKGTWEPSPLLSKEKTVESVSTTRLPSTPCTALFLCCTVGPVLPLGDCWVVPGMATASWGHLAADLPHLWLDSYPPPASFSPQWVNLIRNPNV